MTIIITFDLMIQPRVSSSPSTRNKGVGVISPFPPPGTLSGIIHSAVSQQSAVPLETKGLSALKAIILRALDTKISCPGNPLR